MPYDYHLHTQNLETMKGDMMALAQWVPSCHIVVLVCCLPFDLFSSKNKVFIFSFDFLKHDHHILLNISDIFRYVRETTNFVTPI